MMSHVPQNPDERIYIIATYSPYARELLCEVSPYSWNIQCVSDFCRFLATNLAYIYTHRLTIETFDILPTSY